jgi:hypothetical protein
MSGPRFRPHWASAAVLAGGLLGLTLAGCGGSGHPAPKSRSTQVARTGAKGSGSGGSSPNVKATLLGPNHDPVAQRNWTYTVHVADVHGRPLAGTLETEFTYHGVVVGKDTPPNHTFSHGHYREKLKFPATAVGYPVDLQVVVHTKLGSVTVDWPVTVRK